MGKLELSGELELQQLGFPNKVELDRVDVNNFKNRTKMFLFFCSKKLC